MSQLLEVVKELGVALIDPWCVVDAEDRIVEHSPSFRALFSRELGRRLVGMTCAEALRLSTADVRRAIAQGPLRLHEQTAELEGQPRRFQLGAAPVALPEGGDGVLLLLRDVTEEAQLQQRYQALEEQARQAKEELESELDERTRDLLTANDLINRLERELARYKRGEL